MATRNLTFVETLTIEQFKEKVKVDKIQVKRNPHTNKLFCAFGGKTGAVASKGIPQHPMMSLVVSEESGEQFWLLHEEATGGAPTLATF